MTKIITIKTGSRNSPLALKQVDEIDALLRQQGIELSFERKTFQTKGDLDKITSLVNNRDDDFFTDRLDQALLDGEIDLAIHSAKDLPEEIPQGLEIFVLTQSLDETDAFVGKEPFKDLKPGAKVGTSSVLRQDSIRKLNPNVKIVDVRGTIEERIKLVEEGVCDGVVIATVALKRLGLESKIKDIMPWEATPLQGQLAVLGRASDKELKRTISAIDIRRTFGEVTLVGAGPGDPDLITVKGIKALRRANCVFYDYLISKDLLEYAPRAEHIYAGKRKGEHTLSQDELCTMLRKKAQEGKRVVRLKGGDPLIFGRGADEIQYLKSFHIDVKVVAGVSSATAIATGLGLPLTARNLSSSVSFVSAHVKDEREGVYKSIDIPNTDTVVFLMGITKLQEIVASLKEKGWDKDSAIVVIAHGTCLDEVIVDGSLDTIEEKVAQAKLTPPALIVVGKTVEFWRKHFKQKQTILYTGTNPNKYKDLGRVLHLPMIDIKESEEKAQPAGVDYEYVLLTSRFAVKYFLQNNSHQGLKAIVIGQDTADTCERMGVKPFLVAREETSEGLLKAILDKIDVAGKAFLFPRSSLPNPFLKDELIKIGAKVDEVTVYENIKPPKRDLPQDNIDAVIFTSPSTVKNFIEDYGSISRSWRILSRGPKTTAFLNQEGYTNIEEIQLN